jgi:hypothetical protein
MTVSKAMRRSHMYLALFLTPWLVVYALSGFVLNHHSWFMPQDGKPPAPFVLVEERAYDAAFSADADEKLIGAQVLEHLGLAGSFYVQGNAKSAKLVINRNSAFAQHRVTYDRQQGKLRVEKQSFTAPMFVNRAHFRHGYEQPFAASMGWAVIVDLVVLSLVFWVISGLWMWWEIKPARAWGAVFGALGVGLFVLLLFNI